MSLNKPRKLRKIEKEQLLIYILTFLIIAILIYTFWFADLWRAEKGVPSSSQKSESGYAEEPLLGPDVVSCEDLGCPTGTEFVGSSGSNVYHNCYCLYALAILPDNRICFMNASEAEGKGYRKATVC